MKDVLDYPGNKVYVVEGEHKYMIPAVKAFVLDTDMDTEITEIVDAKILENAIKVSNSLTNHSIELNEIY